MSAARRAISISIILVASMATRANALGANRTAPQGVLCQAYCYLSYGVCLGGGGGASCYGSYQSCLANCDIKES
jgi:hypothetical protein